jgi:hypothetical protein
MAAWRYATMRDYDNAIKHLEHVAAKDPNPKRREDARSAVIRLKAREQRNVR